MKIPGTNYDIPVPGGEWVLVQTKPEIILTGPLPNTDYYRNRTGRITIPPGALGHRTKCRYEETRQRRVRYWDGLLSQWVPTGDWKNSRVNVVRRADTLLFELAVGRMI